MNPQITTPTVEFARRFSSTRRGARLARILALGQLDAWGVPHDSEGSDTAALIVAELAANAVLHGRVPGRDFELRLVLGTVLRIEVTDTRADRLPHRPEPVGEDEGGRGLLLVEALARAWGVDGRTPGKTVWAEVDLGATARS
ncbi:ATP-binding protein [Streptomyces sp. TLI_146]|uniref:ATP-binding protein n=1 Tax=Streptomyces sp. TLI_146 TaxID=1938858 RepID=UPI000C6FE067|nr:ATP-binding protein [Streptomyces sp. TLI_146]PKV87174.1 histidine kinase-like protein [Streptomyces sp. TLI_146]